MLRALNIQNYALIDKLELSLDDKLTIITGETGAGKSILLGALGLILGNRADSSVLYDKTKKVIVEGTFNIKHYALKDFFSQEELDYDEETIIRREISTSGKSRAFINDTPVTLQILKQLSSQLVDLHAQHQTFRLNDKDFQLYLIDAIAEQSESIKKYRANYHTYQNTLSKLNALIEKDQSLTKEMDYILFQLNELLEANLDDPSEQENLEKELLQLNNSEDIKKSLNEASYILEGDEQAINAQLNFISQSLQSLKDIVPDIEKLYDRLESSRLELQDITKEFQLLNDSTVYDAERIQEINDRINTLNSLHQKHQTQDLNGLVELKSSLENRSAGAEDLKEEIQALEKDLENQKKKLLQTAKQISKSRHKAIPHIESSINESLADIGMAGATLKVSHAVLADDAFTADGIDVMEILFSANAGSDPQPIKKVASGGELSRLMLSVKSMIARSVALPTLIFDEIDTGISGEVAHRVGIKLSDLATNHQIISITHLPQIASKGSTHLFVHKEMDKERTYTRIKTLTEEERILEIAKMLSGEKPSSSAMENAKELLLSK